MKFGITAAYCDVGSWRGAEHVEVAQRDRLEPVGDAEAAAVALGGELAGRVGRDRQRGHVLVLGQLRVGAVDRRGGGEDDAADAGVARREQHVQRPDHVRRVARERILDRARHGRQRRLVEDDLAAAHRLAAPARSSGCRPRPARRRHRRTAMFDRRPVAKLSSSRTSWPSPSRRAARWEPMNPPPPVTKILTAAYPSRTRDSQLARLYRTRLVQCDYP